MSYSVKFNGFKTSEQALAFAQWYSGQGEQTSDEWMKETCGVDFVGVNDIKTDEVGDIHVGVRVIKKGSH
jgi:hypothetical protein